MNTKRVYSLIATSLFLLASESAFAYIIYGNWPGYGNWNSNYYYPYRTHRVYYYPNNSFQYRPYYHYYPARYQYYYPHQLNQCPLIAGHFDAAGFYHAPYRSCIGY